MADRASQPVVYRYAIFVKIRKNGKTAFNRRPYDVVELDWRNGERYTYIQPLLGGVPAAGSATAQNPSLSSTNYRNNAAGGEGQECIYDDVRFYTEIPAFDLCAADHKDFSNANYRVTEQPRGFNPA